MKTIRVTFDSVDFYVADIQVPDDFDVRDKEKLADLIAGESDIPGFEAGLEIDEHFTDGCLRNVEAEEATEV